MNENKDNRRKYKNNTSRIQGMYISFALHSNGCWKNTANEKKNLLFLL